jgi:ABC-2 type transport system ATP-binding protein
VGIIDRGHIVAEGTPAALKAEIGHSAVELVPAAPEERERLAAVMARFGEATPSGGGRGSNSIAVRLHDGAEDLGALVRAVDAEGLRFANLQLHTPTLDDVFLAKTGRSLEGAGDGAGDAAAAETAGA